MKIQRLKLTNLPVFFFAVLLCSCASLNDPQYYNDAKRLEHGNYVNGTDKFQDSTYCFLTTRDRGVVVVEFDSKPFFMQGRGGQKIASPVRFPGYACDLIVSPGPHSVTLTYEDVAPDGILGAALGIDKVTAKISNESQLEFVAEKGHTYVIKANASGDRKSWRPEIQDLPPKQHDQ